MATVRRTLATYAITILTYQRRSLFQRTERAELMIDTLFRYRDQGRFAVHAFVIMPDHIHVLITPALDQSTSAPPAASNSSREVFPSPSASNFQAKSGTVAITNTESATARTLKLKSNISPTTHLERTMPITDSFIQSISVRSTSYHCILQIEINEARARRCGLRAEMHTPGAKARRVRALECQG